MKVLASNLAWEPISAHVGERFSKQLFDPCNSNETFQPGFYEWPALLRRLDGRILAIATDAYALPTASEHR